MLAIYEEKIQNQDFIGAGAYGVCTKSGNGIIKKLIDKFGYMQEKENLQRMNLLLSSDDSQQLLEMPYYDGLSLDKMIKEYQDKKIYKNEQKPVMAKLYMIAINLLEKVKDLHDKYSLVHKDLKPQNIIVKPETSEVFIIDFGSAGGEGKTLKKYGTQSYFAPEIKDDEDSDSAIFTYKTDLYATGLILEEIIALTNTVCPRMRKAREFLYLVETSENLKQVNPDKRIIDIKKIKEETDQISLQNLNITNDQPKEPEYKKLSLPR